MRIGDVLTIKAFTRSGYVQSVNVPVYGTFQFQGLEKSTLAGALNLMDLVSFRELYGFMSGEKLAEIQALQKAAGAHDVSRENAEAELFGSKPSAAEEKAADKRTPQVEATTTPGVAPGCATWASRWAASCSAKRRAAASSRRARSRRGVVLNAAVILKDPKKITETMADIEAQGAKDGLTLKAIDWQKAAGLIGQFIDVARTVLYIAILIIFIVALVIINNAMVMATLERVREIGTLRAIGAQRRFILSMLVIEAIVVGLGVRRPRRARWAPCSSASSARSASRRKSDVWFFFFSGPRLYPVHRHQQRRRGVHHRAAGERLLQLLPRLARDAGHPAPGHAGRTSEPCPSSSSSDDRLPQPGAAPPAHAVPRRRHRRRHGAAGAADGLSTGMRETMLDAATTLSTGHVNVGGFFKVTAGQAAPVVTDYKKVLERRAEGRPGAGRSRSSAAAAGPSWSPTPGSMQVGHRRHRHRRPSRSSRR